MPHGFSYLVLPRIAWGLMFELCLIRQSAPQHSVTLKTLPPYPVMYGDMAVITGSQCFSVSAVSGG